MAVSIGHSDATLDQANAGIDAGARMFTHLFNAMRPLHHRDPGVIAAALLPSEALPAVIPDSVHVHPAMLRLVYRTRGGKADADHYRQGGAGGNTALKVLSAEHARIRDGAAR